jgi:hypothetical protein
MLNLEGRIGGDAALSHRGEEYALKLPDLVRESVGVSHLGRLNPFVVTLRVPSHETTPCCFGGLACRPPA